MIAALNFLLLGVGLFLDIGAAILLFAPLTLLVAVSAGIDPIHFGVILVVNGRWFDATRRGRSATLPVSPLWHCLPHRGPICSRCCRRWHFSVFLRSWPPVFDPQGRYGYASPQPPCDLGLFFTGTAALAAPALTGRAAAARPRTHRFPVG